ncbi:MAG: hypothetical protein DLM59_13180 [Pseudonocardiales bacterium]|nr:MAG: hypothetical protein DLM59_13180 [Pseudonocardiales bacterium]
MRRTAVVSATTVVCTAVLLVVAAVSLPGRGGSAKPANWGLSASLGLRYHRGMIENSLGQSAAARVDLSAALDLNPNFSFVQAPLARRALVALGGQR